MDTKDLHSHFLHRGHSQKYLALMCEDIGNVLQRKEDTKVKGLCVCCKGSKKIANCNELVKSMSLHQTHHRKDTSRKILKHSLKFTHSEVITDLLDIDKAIVAYCELNYW